MKSYLIARVSTEDQKDALPAQTMRLVNYAEQMSYDYELFEFSESAYKGNRDKFRIILEKIMLNSDPVIVVFDKFDRFTRDSTSEEYKILKDLSLSGKIEIHFVSDNLRMDSKVSANDKFMIGMSALNAQYYSDAISDNVKRKLEHMWSEGLWAGRAPIGYKNITKANGKKWIETDPLYAQVIRESYELYSQGITSLRGLKKKWNSEYGLVVSVSQLEKVMKNPFYHGEMLVKGKKYPHGYEQIISRDLFDKAQHVRLGYPSKKHRWVGLPYPYRGLINCAECGCRITYEKKKQLYVYAHCTQSKYKHNATYINELVLTEKLQELIKAIELPQYAYEQVSEAMRISYEECKSEEVDTINTLSSEILKFKKRLERLYDDYVDEVLTKDDYQQRKTKYEDSIQKLEEKKQTFELSIDSHYGTVSHLLELSRNASNLFQNANIEQKRSLINSVLSNLLLDGKELRSEYKKPFDTMAFCNRNLTWQG